MSQPLIINGIDFNERLDLLHVRLYFNIECIFARDIAREYIFSNKGIMVKPWRYFIAGLMLS